MSNDQQKKFEEWTKEQIYEAYLSEYITRRLETDRANEYLRKIKRIEWELTQIKKKIDSGK